jgi:hypothetical protein
MKFYVFRFTIILDDHTECSLYNENLSLDNQGEVNLLELRSKVFPNPVVWKCIFEEIEPLPIKKLQSSMGV